jgi:hypothetical protein
MEQAWAAAVMADVATVRLIAIFHGESRRASVMKRWSPHPVMASTIIDTSPSSCAGRQQGSRAHDAVPPADCGHKYPGKERIMQQPHGFWDTTMGITLVL